MSDIYIFKLTMNDGGEYSSHQHRQSRPNSQQMKQRSNERSILIERSINAA
ncbi:hypothetical protein [uncultured Enterobacter sp.]|uniref:hypothetical protein n=1 Tax=uncultured Enterobacter sp. TaxID=238202 RepID=UPI00258919F8|nr:hypothetical protein [uncultured Enterobacter sp.]